MLADIQAGYWNRWHPRAVKIYVNGFVERDIEGKWIQALLAKGKHERRLYVVTITPIIRDMAYERWPRILGG